MLVAHVRNMGMPVMQRLVRVISAVRTDWHRIMGMGVVTVVMLVGMFMVHRVMRVVVFMVFQQMQCRAAQHQHPTDLHQPTG